MTFNGLPFLLGFLPFVLCGFAASSRFGANWAKSWLILASLVFYAAGTAFFLPLLLASVAGNLVVLHLVHGSRRPGRWIVAGAAANLALLGWFKYLSPDAVTPLGLSFFTFTQIGCLLHFSGGDIPPPKWRDYTLFAASFPALLAGPILNPREMLGQFERDGDWRLTSDNLAVGSGFFVIGLLKKTVLADPLGPVVSAGFADPLHLTLLAAWQAAAAYSLRLYFDFSGYTDMAIGLAWMFGLRFPDNFDQPYRARSVIEYWQRWHMSLTRFLMNTVHAPMTLAILRRRRRLAQPINTRAQRSLSGFTTMIAAPLFITMVLIALWHGATWPFLVFGLLHAGFPVVNHAWRLAGAPKLPAAAAVALTYLCTLAGAVFFRATSVTGALSMLAGMAGLHGIGPIQPDAWSIAAVLWLVALYAIIWCMPTTRQWMSAGPEVRRAWRPSPAWSVVMGCGAALGLLAAGGTGEFLYFRF